MSGQFKRGGLVGLGLLALFPSTDLTPLDGGTIASTKRKLRVLWRTTFSQSKFKLVPPRVGGVGTISTQEEQVEDKVPTFTPQCLLFLWTVFPILRSIRIT